MLIREDKTGLSLKIRCRVKLEQMDCQILEGGLQGSVTILAVLKNLKEVQNLQLKKSVITETNLTLSLSKTKVAW